MLFNSIPFAVFFVIFFVLYWIVFKQSLKLQNLLLLAGSYFFYAWWDWRFLSLLAGSSILNYYLGIFISKSANERNRRLLLITGLLQGIGGLLFFKYYNFFITSFADAFSIFNIKLEVRTLQLILPLGISFYTFRTISYLLDIDKGKIKPTTDPVVFFSYVAFFPSLISGPIDRSKLLIPQLEKKRTFEYSQVTDGMRQVLWGLFKKIVVADNCAAITNQIFDNYANLPASSLVLGAVFYSFQLYADFSGYSDMAIGFARMLGFNITKNFNFPFFAQNIAEYWRRWHISLTSWLTDYVFTPLSISFRDYGKAGLILAILLNFVVVGLWHGANWTFIWFGFLHGCYFVPLIIRGTMNKKKKIQPKKILPSFLEFRNILLTFILVTIANIIFRSDSMSYALNYFQHIFSASVFSYPLFTNRISALISLIFSCVLLLSEWLQRDKNHALEFTDSRPPKIVRWAIYYTIGIVIIWYGGYQETFIYFQF
jgi:D-alanyl-lipoteichoic acid acyltransferase DltB (MBOAT superfamily)